MRQTKDYYHKDGDLLLFLFFNMVSLRLPLKLAFPFYAEDLLLLVNLRQLPGFCLLEPIPPDRTPPGTVSKYQAGAEGSGWQRTDQGCICIAIFGYFSKCFSLKCLRTSHSKASEAFTPELSVCTWFTPCGERAFLTEKL